MRSTFSVIFYLKKEKLKKDGTNPIMGRITVDGTMTQFSCKVSCDPAIWEAKGGHAKGKSVAARDVNRELDKIKASVVKHYQEIMIRDGYVTAEKVKNSFLGLEYRKQTLMSIFEQWNTEYAKQVEGGLKAKNTFERYKAVYKHVGDFLQFHYHVSDMALKEIMVNFLSDFEIFLKTEKHVAHNTVETYVKPVMMLMHRAQENGWVARYPFGDYHIQREEVEKGFLTKNELQAVIIMCGSDTWDDVELFCRSQFDYFKKRLPNLRGTPSHDTLNRFFSVLDTAWFESAFRSWVANLCEQISGVVAIDGKAVCRNPEADKNSLKSRLYMVSAWSADNGICLGQEKVNSKSNEITALPKLIEALDLEGCIVTIDAIGCQKSIAGAIRKAGADYLLCAKKNQKHVKNVVAALVKEEHKKDGICKWYNQVNEGHGRKEWRECVCTDFERQVPYFLEGWTDLRTLARVTEKRQLAGGEITKETRYYITSLPADPKMILKASRRHWSVENELHWRMDVAFREDYSRKTDNAAINFSAICKIALMKLKEYKLKVGVASKRKMCGWDEKTRDMVLGIR